MSWASSCPGAGRDRGPTPSVPQASRAVARGAPPCAGHRSPLRRELDAPDHAAPAWARPRRGRRRGGPWGVRRAARRRRRASCARATRGASTVSPTPSCSPRRRASEYFGADHAVGPLTSASWSSRSHEVDRRGVHVANIEGMRRAVAGLARPPGYVLTDGFPVRGLRPPGARRVEGRSGGGLRRGRVGAGQGHPGPASWSRCDDELSAVRFAEHKGYCTPDP